MKAALAFVPFHRLRSERFQRVGKEFVWITIGQAAAVLGALVGIRVLTELLEPAEYGQLALGMTMATLVNQVVLGPLSNGATRFYAPAREAGALHPYFATVRGMVVISTGGIILAALLIGGGVALIGLSQWWGLVIAALCFALLSGYNSVLNGIQNAARQRAIVAFHQGLASWGQFLVAAGLMLWLGTTSTVAMMGYVLAMLLVLASQYGFFKRIVNSAGSDNAVDPNADRHWRAKIFTFSWPFAAWGIFTWAQQVSDRWALGLFSSTQEVGLYAVLFQLGYYPISILTNLVVQLIAPVFFQRAGDATSTQRMEQVNLLNLRLAWLALGLTAFAFLLTLILHDLVFRVLVAPAYASVSYLLPWMLMSGGVFAAGQIISINFMSELKTRNLVVPKITTAILGICCNFIGAYFYGVVGIVTANVVFSVIYFFWMMLRSRK